MTDYYAKLPDTYTYGTSSLSCTGYDTRWQVATYRQKYEEEQEVLCRQNAQKSTSANTCHSPTEPSWWGHPGPRSDSELAHERYTKWEDDWQRNMYGSKTYQDLKCEVHASRPSMWETEVAVATTAANGIGAQFERHRTAERTLDDWVNGNRKLWKEKGRYLLLQHPNKASSCWSGCSIL